jgi:hypothetical protein
MLLQDLGKSLLEMTIEEIENLELMREGRTKKIQLSKS